MNKPFSFESGIYPQNSPRIARGMTLDRSQQARYNIMRQKSFYAINNADRLGLTPEHRARLTYSNLQGLFRNIPNTIRNMRTTGANMIDPRTGNKFPDPFEDEETDRIATALEAGVPDPNSGEEPNEDQSLLFSLASIPLPSAEDDEDEPEEKYGVIPNFAEIRKAQAHLDNQKKSHPHARKILDTMSEMLETIAAQEHIEYAKHIGKELRSELPSNVALTKIGKMAAFLVISAGLTLTGIPAIVRFIRTGNLDGGPVVYGAAMLYLLGYFKSTSEASEAAKQSSTVVANPDFMNMKLQGEEWEKVVGRILDNPEQAEKVVELRKNSANVRDPKLTKAKELAVSTFASDAPLPVRKELEKMVQNGQFTRLQELLSKVDNEDGQKYIKAYVKLGLRKYARS